VFILLSFLEGYSATEAAEPNTLPKIAPSVAIIVPCFNEEKTVRGTIESLLASDYPKEKLSIIVVDDGSKDATYAQALSITDPRLQVFKKENGGKFTAMNFALSKTDADIIGCLDADSFVDPHAITASVAHMTQTKSVAVTPAIIVEKPQNLLQLAQRVEYSMGIFIRRAFSAAGTIFITPGPLSLFNRAVILELGGWRHAHGTEDLEMGLRLQERRYKITNTPRARVLTKTPDTLYKLYKQRVRWSYGFLMNAFDYRFMFFRRKYGALGMVVFPAALASIFITLYFCGLIMYSIADTVIQAYVRYSILGFHWHIPHLELFFVNTTPISLMSLFMTSLALVFLAIGKTLSKTEFSIIHVPLYFFSFFVFTPIWLTGALIRASMRAQAPWR
jgi:cellulose synthase/poly-beta-1,6-N-acetylglucosamine synthase-like glycosyltransferase